MIFPLFWDTESFKIKTNQLWCRPTEKFEIKHNQFGLNESIFLERNKFNNTNFMLFEVEWSHRKGTREIKTRQTESANKRKRGADFAQLGPKFWTCGCKFFVAVMATLEGECRQLIVTMQRDWLISPDLVRNSALVSTFGGVQTHVVLACLPVTSAPNRVCSLPTNQK